MASISTGAGAVTVQGVRHTKKRTPWLTVILLVGPFLIIYGAFLIYPTIILFIGAWNNFFWPFIVIGKTPMMTIPVGITQVQSWYGIAYPRQMASAVLAALPTAVLFVIFQRRVAQGVAITSGTK